MKDLIVPVVCILFFLTLIGIGIAIELIKIIAYLKYIFS